MTAGAGQNYLQLNMPVQPLALIEIVADHSVGAIAAILANKTAAYYFCDAGQTPADSMRRRLPEKMSILARLM